MRLALVVSMVLVGAPAPALAQQPAHILRGNGEKAIAVWRDESSAETGKRLAAAGQLDLASRYLACAVPPGTRIVVLPGGHDMQRVMIVEGKSRGCEGSVYTWDINGDRKHREAESKKWREENERDSKRALDESKRALDDAQKRLDDIRKNRGSASGGWPEWKKYLECSERRTDPAEDCTRHLQ